MTKQEIIEALCIEHENSDVECAHVNADNLLLQYINDNEISEAFEAVPRWYA